MSRGKSVTKLLLDSSQEALFAAIEIHNKPNIAHRYQTTVILLINAWELALKAYVYKYISKRNIYERNRHTISFSKALNYVRDDINKKESNHNFDSVFENLNHLNDYRCSNVHYFEKALDPVMLMLVSKSVLNYDEFIKKYFNKDITKNDNLMIMPIGMRLPFNPIDFLKQDFGSAHNDFVNSVIETIKGLDANGVEDSIVIGFNLYADRVKRITNADIVAALGSDSDAVQLRKSYRITDDPKAPSVRMEPDVLPLTYEQLRCKVKKEYPGIKFSKLFNTIMKEIKSDVSLCQSRYLDPRKKSGTKKDFYSEKAVHRIIEEYKKREKTFVMRTISTDDV